MYLCPFDADAPFRWRALDAILCIVPADIIEMIADIPQNSILDSFRSEPKGRKAKKAKKETDTPLKTSFQMTVLYR